MADAPTEPLTLAAEFPPATHAQWRKLVDGVLKGRPFDRLVARTYDRLSIEPLYASDAKPQPIEARAPGAPWQILQRVDHPNPAAANAEALHDLQNGATGLSLVFPDAIGSYGYAMDPSATALARTLDGVHLDAGIALELNLTPFNRTAAQNIAALAKERGHDPASLDIRFSLDPLCVMAHAGYAAMPWKDIAPVFGHLIGELSGHGFKGPFAAADGRPIHAAGGSEAQELAFVLAVGVAYLRALEQSGIPLDDARGKIFFRLAADADQFLTIAKFRALRKLWARVEQACGLAPRTIFISAETAWRMMTRRDPYVNMLRTTVATFSAAIGGADAITVLPYTAALGLPDRFARRVARNTQLVLAEESHLAKVSDPAAGSGAMEGITDELCRAAWEQFQAVEAAGGAAAALAAGLIQNNVAAVRAEREQAVAHRREVLTGTSEFPLLTEPPVSVLDIPALQDPAPRHGATRFAPLPRMRLSEPFERLRDASDKILASTGARPKVFLANLGKPADFLARATFAKNFFEAGGIEAVTNDGFADQAAIISAFKQSKAVLACLCSSDDIYALEGPAAGTALLKTGARHVFLAGRPGELGPALKVAGVQSFVYAGCDALATLRDAYDILGA
jgi:methylmalonyl-CoA mutase